MKHLRKINENYDEEITFVKGDDWEGVYINGELKDQGHSVDRDYLLELLGHKPNNIYIEDEKIWEEFGFNCPEKLNDVQVVLNAKKYNL